MTQEHKPDPLEGFHVTDYDEDQEFVTIKLHRSVLENPNSREAIRQRCVDIIEGGPNVKGVHIEPRDDS